MMYTAQFLSLPQMCEGLRSLLGPVNNHLRVLLVGDVVAQAGRKILGAVVPVLRQELELDFVTINGENLAGGFGITHKIFFDVRQMGVDCITMGNHWADKSDVHELKAHESSLVLPANLTQVSAQEFSPEFLLRDGRYSVSVINLMGLFGMKEAYANPFEYLARQVPFLQDKRTCGSHFVLVDMHAEASSEKQAVACYLDGIAAGFIGSHTHVPTSDERITASGTAFVTDIGMTGPYDSIIGMTKERSLKRYFPPQEKKAQEAAKRDPWFNGFLIDISTKDMMSSQAFRLQFRESCGHWIVRGVQRPLVTEKK